MEYYGYDELLSRFACKSCETKGRERYVPPCPVRTEFQRDRDRIIHSKSFRRLKHKTQVFLSPEGDHYRTRLTHTLEVAQIARTIARSLRLNEDLTEAIALGHDIGHTPFGHAGEAVLNKLNPHGFAHNVHSLRVVDTLENNGEGLNLTYEVRDGILNHKSDGNPQTLEGIIVSYADRIAYINHDIEDAISADILNEKDIPIHLTRYLGDTKSRRISKLIIDIIEFSYGTDYVSLSPDSQNALNQLREFMFRNVYSNNVAKDEESKAEYVLNALYGYYSDNADELPPFYNSLLEIYDIDTVVTDYIAGMTDRYSLKVFNKIFVPHSWELEL